MVVLFYSSSHTQPEGSGRDGPDIYASFGCNSIPLFFPFPFLAPFPDSVFCSLPASVLGSVPLGIDMNDGQR